MSMNNDLGNWERADRRDESLLCHWIASLEETTGVPCMPLFKQHEVLSFFRTISQLSNLEGAVERRWRMNAYSEQRCHELEGNKGFNNNQ